MGNCQPTLRTIVARILLISKCPRSLISCAGSFEELPVRRLTWHLVPAKTYRIERLFAVYVVQGCWHVATSQLRCSGDAPFAHRETSTQFESGSRYAYIVFIACIACSGI